MSIEADPSRGGDFIATIPPLPEAVKAIQWDEVEWIHGVGSVYPWEAIEVMAELHSIMEPGGLLVLEQPDARNCDPALHPEWAFGDPSLRQPLHMNKWIYTPAALLKILDGAGFKHARMLPAQHHVLHRDFRIEATA